MESRHRHSTGRLGIFAAGSRSGRQRPMHPKLIRDGTWSDAVSDLMVSEYYATDLPTTLRAGRSRELCYTPERRRRCLLAQCHSAWKSTPALLTWSSCCLPPGIAPGAHSALGAYGGHCAGLSELENSSSDNPRLRRLHRYCRRSVELAAVWGFLAGVVLFCPPALRLHACFNGCACRRPASTASATTALPLIRSSREQGELAFSNYINSPGKDRTWGISLCRIV